MKKILFIPFIALLSWSCNSQLANSSTVTSTFSLLYQQQIDSSDYQLFLRAFKNERILEVWAKNRMDSKFKKIQEYTFCTSSGTLGPKRQEGDLQIPEGCYWVDRFNPNSNFYLSLGLNYPNDSDRKLSHSEHPGSDIFIHGGCASVGCIPITNSKIEELYSLAEEAQKLGQQKIQVHIFPSKEMDILLKNSTEHLSFWNNLLPIFNHFEAKKQLPKVWIKPDGAYAIAS
jgi:murein L,D-transpeptidase YafK